MLELVDAILTGFFGYVMPVLVGLVGFGAALALIVVGVKEKHWLVTSECVGAGMTIAAVTYGYYIWLEQFRQIQGETGVTDPAVMDATLALLVATAALAAASFIRYTLFVPWLLIGLFAWGVILFGW